MGSSSSISIGSGRTSKPGISKGNEHLVVNSAAVWADLTQMPQLLKCFTLPAILKTVNTFEQLRGRQIKKVLRLDTGENFPPLSSPLAIYLMLDESSGLLIGFGFRSHAITLNYMAVVDLHEEYGTEWGESSLNELEPSDKLNSLVGQTLKSIELSELKPDKLIGDNFVIKDDKYAQAVLQTMTDRLTISSTNEGGQIKFDRPELP